MKIKITAKRWDEPIVFPCKSVTIKEVAQGTAHSRVQVLVDNDTQGSFFELDPEYGETVEVIS